jgi:hypothetical protein
MRRFGVTRLLVVGAVLASVFMAGSGFVTAAPALLLQRLLAGVASAWVFVAGGLLAARLGEADARGQGPRAPACCWASITAAPASASCCPRCWCRRFCGRRPACRTAGPGRGGRWRSRALAGHLPAGLGRHARCPTGRRKRHRQRPPPRPRQTPVALRRFGWALAGYALFGMGYIGYMTFVIALLREQGASAGFVTLFYALLGIACVASSRLWAGLLDRYRGGQPQALLNGCSAWPRCCRC